MKARNMAACLAALVVILSGCGASTTTETPTPAALTTEPGARVLVKGEVRPAAWATLSAQSGGMVIEVLAKPGDTLAASDVLIRLDPTDAQLAVGQAETAVRSAEARLASLKAGPRAEGMAVAEAQVRAAQAVVSQTIAQRDQLWSGATQAEIAAAEAEVARAKAEQRIVWDQHEQTMQCHDVVLPDGSQKEVCPALGTLEEQARFRLQAADEAVAAAQAQLEAAKGGAHTRLGSAEASVGVSEAQRDVAQAQSELLRAGAAPGEIAIAEVAVAQARASLEVARVALERCEIRAPFAGTIGAVKVRAGEPVVPGQPLIVLGDLTTLRVETTNVDDVDVARITVGQPVVLSFDALPGQEFAARVTGIAPMAEPDPMGGFNYTVLVEPDRLPVAVRWGMKASVAIEVE